MSRKLVNGKNGNSQTAIAVSFKCNRTRHFAKDFQSAKRLNQIGSQEFEINDRSAQISVAENFQNFQSSRV